MTIDSNLKNTIKNLDFKTSKNFEIKAVQKKGRKLKIINNCFPDQSVTVKLKKIVPFYSSKIHLYVHSVGKIGHIRVEDYNVIKNINSGRYIVTFSHWFDDGEFFEAFVKIHSVQTQ
ncbi:MAG: hypothetical protein V7767_03855 [Leeuwenhoekiella sp.]